MPAEFIDSNVFVYLFDKTQTHKKERARSIIEQGIRNGDAIISFQVVQEVLNVITHKMTVPVTDGDAVAFLDSVLMPMCRVYPSDQLYRQALDLKQRFRYGFFDSLILASAMESGCTRVITEDMQHGQRIGNLLIFDPFQ